MDPHQFRLAPLTRDKAGAIGAYAHCLALPEDREHPLWRAVRDSMRRELGQPAGEPRRSPAAGGAQGWWTAGTPA